MYNICIVFGLQRYLFKINLGNKYTIFFTASRYKTNTKLFLWPTRFQIYNQMTFANELIAWYQEHKRDLPWRHSTNPYVLWLSEIILQQTRVDQGLPYFHRFLTHYPTIADFAAASEGEILNDWQGLGYYSRARNMHHTAKMVMEQFDGRFPSSYDDLVRLKGVGDYTAAAISSFSSNEARAVLDGNVFRVLARYFGIATPINSSKGKKQFSELAQELLPPKLAGVYNQAIMEFGALQCKPVNPLCETCPLRTSCTAFSTNQIQNLPVKLKQKPARKRFFNYVVLLHEDSIAIQQRGAGDIWQGLYEFPLLESATARTPEELIYSDDFKQKFGDLSHIKWVHGPVKHLLSHQQIFAQFIVMEASDTYISANKGQFKPFAELENVAQPKLIFEFIIKLFTFKLN
jgi:A/G-specific adenine glycosylase